MFDKSFHWILPFYTTAGFILAYTSQLIRLKFDVALKQLEVEHPGTTSEWDWCSQEKW